MQSLTLKAMLTSMFASSKKWHLISVELSHKAAARPVAHCHHHDA